MTARRRFARNLLVLGLGLPALVAGAAPAAHAEAARKIFGVAPAIVVDVADPDKQGRVKVKFPWLPGEGQDEFWARVVQPIEGARLGFFVLPEVADEVLVAFEHGDVHHPYVLGSLWNGTDRPPK